MNDPLDDQINRLLVDPSVQDPGDPDLASAVLALLWGQRNRYTGRRDLYALEKRVKRLCSGREISPVAIEGLHALSIAAELATAAKLDEASPDRPPAAAEPVVQGAIPVASAALPETEDGAMIRLLTTPQPKALGDLALADALVALLWHQERHYQGTIDLWSLRRRLEDYRQQASIDSAKVVRLASREFLAEAGALTRLLSNRAQPEVSSPPPPPPPVPPMADESAVQAELVVGPIKAKRAVRSAAARSSGAK